jgi:hypothetical protein
MAKKQNFSLLALIEVEILPIFHREIEADSRTILTKMPDHSAPKSKIVNQKSEIFLFPIQ